MYKRFKKLSLPAILLCGLSACTAFNEYSTGLVTAPMTNQQQLTPCPSWPRCVSSDSQRIERYIQPFAINASPTHAWRAAQDAVADMPRTRIITSTDNYLHAEIDSPWHFYIDDLELHFRPASQQIAVRSSGRIGYYDFEVNHDRIEALRRVLIQAGVVKHNDEQKIP